MKRIKPPLPDRNFYQQKSVSSSTCQKTRETYYKALRRERDFIRKLLLWNETRVSGKSYGFARRLYYNVLPSLYWTLTAPEDRVVFRLAEESLAYYIYRCKLTRGCKDSVFPRLGLAVSNIHQPDESISS